MRQFPGYFQVPVQKINHDTAMKDAVDFTQGTVEIKGDEQKAERVIKSLQFANYDKVTFATSKKGFRPPNMTLRSTK